MTGTAAVGKSQQGPDRRAQLLSRLPRSPAGHPSLCAPRGASRTCKRRALLCLSLRASQAPVGQSQGITGQYPHGTRLQREHSERPPRPGPGETAGPRGSCRAPREVPLPPVPALSLSSPLHTMRWLS